MIKLFFWFAVVVVLGAGGLYIVGRVASTAPGNGDPGDRVGVPQPVACTADAKICPDGSGVGRNPAKNCEFYPCPEAEAPRVGPTACTEDARICADGSGVGREGARFCAFAACPGEGTVAGTVTLAPSCPYESVFDKPCPTGLYEGELRLEPEAGGAIATAEVYGGKFYATLAAGTYSVSTGKVLPYCEGSFTVVAGKETAFAVSCESGIR